MADLDFRQLLGHLRLRAPAPALLAIALLLPAVLAIALLVPPQARAASRTGGVSPHVAGRHRAAAHRQALVAHRSATRTERIRPRIATVRPAAAPSARPVAAPSRPRPDALPSDATRGIRVRARHHRVWVSRRRSGLRPVDPPPLRTFVVRNAVARATVPAAGAAVARTARIGFGPRRPLRPHALAAERRPIGPRRDGEPATAVISAQATAPVSLPAPSLLPPGGAEGLATSAGGTAAAGTAAALLALLGALFVGALLPGLLELDVLAWRSAVLGHQLERPG